MVKVLFRKIYWWYKKYRWLPKKVANCQELFDQLIKEITSKTEITFIQVGTNDGINNDPLRKHIVNGTFKGILIEPVPSLINDIRKLYVNDSNIKIENVAIDNVDEPQYRDFFYFDTRDLDKHQTQLLNQLGSFSKHHFENYRYSISDFDKLKRTISVKVVSLKDIIDKYHFSTLDILHIDAEGYDYNVLKSFPFNTLTPKIIMLEYVHLSRLDLKACIKLLKKMKYKIRIDDMDLIAWQKF